MRTVKRNGIIKMRETLKFMYTVMGLYIQVAVIYMLSAVGFFQLKSFKSVFHIVDMMCFYTLKLII